MQAAKWGRKKQIFGGQATFTNFQEPLFYKSTYQRHFGNFLLVFVQEQLHNI